MDVWDGCIKTFKKSNMRFLIFIVLMLGITGIAWAQMTDAQVVEAVKSAQAQGKSQVIAKRCHERAGVENQGELRARKCGEARWFGTGK